MEIIQTITTKHNLNKTMPQGVLRMVTVEDHDKAFYAYDTCDVWTSDGWLVTAVQSDGETHHMRKGNEVRIAKLAPETMLHFKPTPKCLYMLGEAA